MPRSSDRDACGSQNWICGQRQIWGLATVPRHQSGLDKVPTGLLNGVRGVKQLPALHS